MNNIKKILLISIGISLLGIVGFVFIDDSQFQANLISQHNNSENQIQIIPNPIQPISEEIHSKKEKNILSSLETHSLRKNEDIGIDIPEYISIEQSEVFETTQSSLALQIKGKKAIGILSFPEIYADSFMKQNTFTISDLEKYIKKNIHFTSSQETCEIQALHRKKTEEEVAQELNPLFLINFSINVDCSNIITNASVSNTIFQEHNTDFAYSLNLFRQSKGHIYPLKSMLSTTEFPYALEWNTSNTMDTTDSDNDGLFDIQEKVYHTDINSFDTDGDGMSDYAEIQKGFDPLISHSSD